MSELNDARPYELLKVVALSILLGGVVASVPTVYAHGSAGFDIATAQLIGLGSTVAVSVLAPTVAFTYACWRYRFPTGSDPA